MIEFWHPAQVHIQNGVKCVSKENGAQRLIFDGRPANLVLVAPEIVSLPAFHLTANWHVANKEYVAFGKIDIDNYYHRLGVPRWMMSVLGLPTIQAKLLGLPGELVIPVCKTLPMGLSHSVCLAQTAHCQLLRQFSSYLDINTKVKATAATWILLYIDDVIIGAKDTTVEKAKCKVNDFIGEILQCYAQHNILVNLNKVVFAQESLMGLGCQLCGVTMCIRPKDSYFKRLVAATKQLLLEEAIDKKGLERLLGHWIWFLLLRRPFFAILFHTYRLLHTISEGTLLLWTSVKREFALLTLLAEGIALSWTRDLAPNILATDASLLGAGACNKQLLPGFGHEDMERELQSCTSIQEGTWTPLVMRKWDFPKHINVLEGRALLLGLLARSHQAPIVHQKIHVVSDSQVVCYAANKGRSSAYYLCAILRCLLAYCVIFDSSNSSSRRSRLTVGLVPTTVTKYTMTIKKFICRNPKWIQKPLDQQLVQYVQSHDLNQQKSIAEGLGTAFKHFFPELTASLPILQRYMRQLAREFKGATKPPIIWDIVIIIMHYLIVTSLPTTALAIFLQFDCYLRPNEVCSVLSHHIAYPNGMYLGSQAQKTLILLPNTKTGPLQSVTIRSSLLIKHLERLTEHSESNVRLFPSYETYRSRIQKALNYYGLQHIGYSPHSIRHGAATMDLINKGEDALPGIPLYRGRWESTAGRLYLQSEAEALLLARLPQEILTTVRRCESQLANALEISHLTPRC